MQHQQLNTDKSISKPQLSSPLRAGFLHYINLSPNFEKTIPDIGNIPSLPLDYPTSLYVSHMVWIIEVLLIKVDV